MLFGKFRARTMDGNKRRVMSIRTTTTIVGIRGSLGEGNTGSDFTNLANLDGDMTIAGEEIPFGEAGFKLDDQLEGLSGLAPSQILIQTFLPMNGKPKHLKH
jgi:hypothetical protein